MIPNVVADLKIFKPRGVSGLAKFTQTTSHAAHRSNLHRAEIRILVQTTVFCSSFVFMYPTESCSMSGNAIWGMVWTVWPTSNAEGPLNRRNGDYACVRACMQTQHTCMQTQHAWLVYAGITCTPLGREHYKNWRGVEAGIAPQIVEIIHDTWKTRTGTTTLPHHPTPYRPLPKP